MSIPHSSRFFGRIAEAAAGLGEMLTPALKALLILQLLSGILVAPLFSLFPVYVEGQLHLSPGFTGNLRSLFVVLGGVVGFLGGLLVDRLGRKPAYLIGMTGVLTSGGLFLAQSPAALLLLGVYGGLTFGLGAVAGQSYLLDAGSRASLGLATAFYFMTGTAGNALGNLVAGRIVQGPGGYSRLGLAILLGQAALIAGAARWMPALPRPARDETEPAAAGNTLGLLRSPGIGLLLALRCLPTVYWGGVTLAVPLLLFRLTGRASVAAYYTSANLVVSAVCQVAMGRLLDRSGPGGPVVTAAALVAVAAVGKWLFWRQAGTLVAFGILGAGAAWSLSVTMPTLIRELSTEATRARLLGVSHMAWSAGFVGGTLIAARLLSFPGREGAVFGVGAAAAAAATACAALLVRRLDRRRRGPEPAPS